MDKMEMVRDPYIDTGIRRCILMTGCTKAGACAKILGGEHEVGGKAENCTDDTSQESTWML